jgi:hypothetical protein
LCNIACQKLVPRPRTRSPSRRRRHRKSQRLSKRQIQAQIDTASGNNAEITVPHELKRPYRVIVSWLAEHKRQVQDYRRDAWGRQPEPFTDTDRRRHRILDTLFKALEAKGFTIKTEQYQPVWFEVQKERIDFQLREKQKQVRRPLTKSEEAISIIVSAAGCRSCRARGI